MTEPIFLAPDEARATYELGTHRGRLLAGAADTGGAYLAAEWTMDAGAPPPPPHRHQRTTETLLLLEGECEFTDGATVYKGGPGTSVTIPPGVLHGFSMINGPVRMVTVHTPGEDAEKLIAAMAEAATIENPVKQLEILAAADCEVVIQ